jgi:aspartate racemase
MKTPGLIGGMSWESTATYYRLLNETVKARMGGFHSARCLLYSVDFAEIEVCQSRGDWARGAAILIDAAQRLQAAGADFIVICTNTMHKVSDQIQAKINIPILHIAEATADALQAHQITHVGLLGTKYTMTQDFYKSKIMNREIDVLIPDDADIELINTVIYHELCLGQIKPESKAEFIRIITNLADRGAQGVILGCTEIGLLVSMNDTAVPLFDTTLIHASAAARMALNDCED